MSKLFPEYLNQGSKGPAVAVLQVLLKAGRFDPNSEITIDGDYGPITAQAVKRLQGSMGVEADGNFGPGTRQVYRVQHWIDVNTLEAEPFCGQIFYVAG